MKKNNKLVCIFIMMRCLLHFNSSWLYHPGSSMVIFHWECLVWSRPIRNPPLWQHQPIGCDLTQRRALIIPRPKYLLLRVQSTCLSAMKPRCPPSPKYNFTRYAPESTTNIRHQETVYFYFSHNRINAYPLTLNITPMTYCLGLNCSFVS